MPASAIGIGTAIEQLPTCPFLLSEKGICSIWVHAEDIPAAGTNRALPWWARSRYHVRQASAEASASSFAMGLGTWTCGASMESTILGIGRTLRSGFQKRPRFSPGTTPPSTCTNQLFLPPTPSPPGHLQIRSTHWHPLSATLRTYQVVEDGNPSPVGQLDSPWPMTSLETSHRAAASHAVMKGPEICQHIRQAAKIILWRLRLPRNGRGTGARCRPSGLPAASDCRYGSVSSGRSGYLRSYPIVVGNCKARNETISFCSHSLGWALRPDLSLPASSPCLHRVLSQRARTASRHGL